MPKKNNNSNTALISVATLLLGMTLAFLLFTYVIPLQETVKQLSIEYAKVHRIQGLLVFIEAEPEREYTLIRTIEGEDLTEIYNSLGIGKEKFGTVMMNIFKAGQQNLVFSQLLEKMAEKAKADCTDAEGIIFTNKMNKCEVIKFE